MSVLASAWAEQGKEVTLLSFDHGEAPAYSLHPAVKLRSLHLNKRSSHILQGLFRNLWRIRVLRRAVRESQPEMVVSFMDSTNILTLVATRWLGVPVIVCEHIDPSRYDIGPIWNNLRRLVYPFADALVCLTEATLARFQAMTKARRWRVIPNPVVGPAGFARCKKNRDRGSAAHILVAMGRLVPQKGFDILLNAFGRIANQHPDWSLKIIGKGPLRVELEVQTETLRLAERVHFAGEVSDPFSALCDADLFVLSSRFEGFGLALCEAMACGLPVVSFDCPSGPADIIRHDVDGILVQPEDSAALAAALGRLMSDDQERERLASHAPEILTRFSRDRILSLWEHLFHDVLHSSGQ
jgi:glycosyltransferase involved in cell wall biosynthesis